MCWWTIWWREYQTPRAPCACWQCEGWATSQWDLPRRSEYFQHLRSTFLAWEPLPCSLSLSLLAHFFSATRWISTLRSCWQPWVPAWRRRMIQVSRQHSPILLKTEEKLQQSFVWLVWFISVISCSLLETFFHVGTLFLKGAGKELFLSPLCLQVNWSHLKPCQVSLKSFSIWTRRMCTYWLCTSSWRSNHFWKV